MLSEIAICVIHSYLFIGQSFRLKYLKNLTFYFFVYNYFWRQMVFIRLSVLTFDCYYWSVLGNENILIGNDVLSLPHKIGRLPLANCHIVR